MLLAFQASAFDRSATCPGSHAFRAPEEFHGTRMITICYWGFCGSAGLGVAVAGLAKGGGESRQGSFLPRTRSGVLSGGTLRALRVSGASSPGGACNGGTSWEPA